jgi:hypothetical protein
MAKLRRTKAPVSKAGTVLTPTVIDELAAEAERGYDLSKAERVVGRPSLGVGGTSPRLSFRVSPDVYDAALQQAAFLAM